MTDARQTGVATRISIPHAHEIANYLAMVIGIASAWCAAAPRFRALGVTPALLTGGAPPATATAASWPPPLGATAGAFALAFGTYVLAVMVATVVLRKTVQQLHLRRVWEEEV